MPKKSRNCVLAMSTAMPFVKAIVTARGMKRTAVPRPVAPITTRSTPDIAVTYLEASDVCFAADEENGLDFRLFLVRIGSAEENAFIKSWLDQRGGPNGLVWTGGNDTVSEGDWMWGQGPTASQFFVGDAAGGGTPYMDQYNDFEPGQPNSSNGTDEDCLILNPDADWQWNDIACTGSEVAFICEQEP
jgi:hypothetical protein